MTDRELLELAAKAADLDVFWWPADDPVALRLKRNNDLWSPLTDDGDALRLAVRLRLSILPDGFNFIDSAVEVIANTGEEVEPWAAETLDGGDPYAATRRAIVRAAAAIGASKGGSDAAPDERQPFKCAWGPIGCSYPRCKCEKGEA